MAVYLFGTPGPRPFAGHFRSRPGGLGWAGRLWALATPEWAWAASEAARGALAGLEGDGEGPEERLRRAWRALYGMEARWMRDRDLCVLFAVPAPGGTLLSGCGLQQVFALEGEALAPLLPEDGPFLRPGLPDLPAVALVPQNGDFYALGAGSALPRGRLARACGIPPL